MHYVFFWVKRKALEISATVWVYAGVLPVGQNLPSSCPSPYVLCLCTECHSVKNNVIVCAAQAGVVSPQVFHDQSSIVSIFLGTTSWATLYHVDLPVSDKCIWLIVGHAIANVARSYGCNVMWSVKHSILPKLRVFIHHLFESSLNACMSCRQHVTPFPEQSP
jgi:hypothetical protein